MATIEHQQIDRYLIRRVLGTGAMGSVYAAWDPKLCREVALKVVPNRLAQEPKARERFVREARAIAAVRHPNVVEIYDYSGIDSPNLYLVIEKLDGQDLYATLHRNGVMGEAVAAAIGHELCLALQTLHEAGIIHRDLKPENVFLNQSGRVVLTDFGIVKAIRDNAAVDGYKESTDVIGTPGFMAPELMSGRGLGPATDIFALGVLLYNLVTKRLPFDGNTPLDIFKAAAAGRYQDPRKFAPTLSHEFCEVIDACLQPSARRRPRSADMVRQSLKAVLEELGVVDVRDDLHSYSRNSAAFEGFARARVIRRVLSQVKVAVKDHDSVATERYRARLMILDPFNEEIAEVSGIIKLQDKKSRPRRLRDIRSLVTDRVQLLMHSGVHTLQRAHMHLPRGAFALAGLVVFAGGLLIFRHTEAQKARLDSAAQGIARPSPSAPYTHVEPTHVYPMGDVTALEPTAKAGLNKAPTPAVSTRPPAAPATVGVDIDVGHGKATVRIDGKPFGRPKHQHVALAVGRHLIEVRSHGHAFRRLINLAARPAHIVINAQTRRISVK